MLQWTRLSDSTRQNRLRRNELRLRSPSKKASDSSAALTLQVGQLQMAAVFGYLGVAAMFAVEL